MLVLLLLGAAVVYAGPIKDETKCGYESCIKYDPSVLNVHIVPHTHDDVGWLKTVDQYYYGSRNYIQKAGVQYILDSVIKELWQDPKRRFIYVETAFFWKWWTHQGDDVRHKVHTLVRAGRLQFVGGAWSMNDEAASHYQSTIDQFTWGLRKLNETFGACGIPRVGWQIDPFGHSREFASLLAAMGYDGLFLGRIDYQDKRARLRNREMEMVWRGDDDLGNSSDIFTGVLYNTYSPPPGFCFDVLCDDEPIIDDPDSPMFNVDERVTTFFNKVREMRSHYKTHNILVTMGDDFQYQDASMWFKNLDKLIQYANLKAAKDGLDIKLFYSTPDCYLRAVKDANPTLPIKQDDFFPYASDPTAYWTGYFTSRPTTKYFERLGNRYLQVLKQLQVVSHLKEHNKFVLNELLSAMGVMQHHDAVTGTEKEHVAHDYERLLDAAIDDASIIARQAFNKISQRSDTKPPIYEYERCRFNESSCSVSENSEQFVVTMYNPLGWRVKQPIRIPVVEGKYSVFSPKGEEIETQLVKIPDFVQNIPTRQSKATHELVFLAYLHPLGVKSYYIRRKRNISKRNTKKSNDIYLNVNDYFKNIKDNIEFEYIDDVNRQEKDVPEIYISEPFRSVNKKIDIQEKIDELSGDTADRKVLKDKSGAQVSEKLENDNDKIDDANADKADWNVLKDKDSTKDYIDEVERLKGIERVLYRSRNYPFVNDDEIRMLADEPAIIERADESYIENEHFKLRLDGSGQITHLILPDRTSNFNVQFFYWTGCVGDNKKPEQRSSGAYIFRPKTTQPFGMSLNITGKPIGRVVQEVWLESDQNVAAIVRFYDKLKFMEIDYTVGPIDITDGSGKEYIIRYETNIVNNGVFYTDSNGRQYLKRKLNERPQWNLTLEEPIAGNYYPVTNDISIDDGVYRMSVLTDRSHGGSSLQEGQIELMLHRRLLHDDAFGVGEALNETANGKGLVVRGRQRVLFEKSDQRVEKQKRIYEYHLEPIVFVADAKDLELNDWVTLDNCFIGLKKELPEGVHLLTLEPWSEGRVLIRFENYLQKSVNSTRAVDFNDIFSFLTFVRFRETTLAANQWLGRDKWTWNKEKEFVGSFNKNYGSFDDVSNNGEEDSVTADDGFVIQLKAKQIRTFIADYVISM
ncbi:lysosomal alpha-mannosidase-like isoform X3 [Zerene cesonia]|uniref:lysosomal alpha-mannosidase-like isoform X3 n=1 Tax=Zerene cesonia TaxID=33412 RepID=UPI0018E58538|nr:lysosomal alpha-mannosidase-like isoform X3 [Zerene cesonia]